MIENDVSVVSSPNGFTQAFNLQNRNISDVFHSEMDVINVSMLGALIEDVVLESAFFANCTFQNATIRNSIFRSCTFSSCWFDQAQFQNVLFEDCEVNDSMRGVRFQEVIFERSALNLSLFDAFLEKITFARLNLEGIELLSRSIGTVVIVDCEGWPIFLDMPKSKKDFEAFKSGGWKPPLRSHFEFESRQEQIDQIDREFGDEVENWYQKWIAGLIE